MHYVAFAFIALIGVLNVVASGNLRNRMVKLDAIDVTVSTVMFGVTIASALALWSYTTSLRGVVPVGIIVVSATICLCIDIHHQKGVHTSGQLADGMNPTYVMWFTTTEYKMYKYSGIATILAGALMFAMSF